MSSDHPLPLAPRDLLILAVLAEGPAHGYGIIKAVESRSQSGVLLDPANLYRALRRMRREGWIREVEAGEPGEPEEAGEPGEGGSAAPQAQHASAETRRDGTGDPRRRVYAITPRGRSLLASELARLQRLLEQAGPALTAARAR